MDKTSWFIKSVDYVVNGCLNETKILQNMDIEIYNGIILNIGRGLANRNNLPVISGNRCVVYPGIINTHHHLYQSILKGVPGSFGLTLSEWLNAVPLRFGRQFDPNLLRLAVKIGITDLLLSGATACADHHTLYYYDTSPEMTDVIFEEANKIGIKLVLCRGFNLKRNDKDYFSIDSEHAETPDQFFKRTITIIDKYKQTGDNNYNSVAIAPGSPFHSCDIDFLKIVSSFARTYKIRMHSHLSETKEDYTEYCKEKFGAAPVNILSENDWVGEDIWYAHVVHVTDEEIKLLADSNTGISHCPTSNARLGTGIAPIMKMINNGIRVSIGVDGSASAEASNALAELYLASLLQKTQYGPNVLSFSDTMSIGSKNGADIIGLHNTGSVEVGKAADIVLYNLNDVSALGFQDQVQAPFRSGGRLPIKHTFINGKIIVSDDHVNGIDYEKLIHESRKYCRIILDKTY